METPGISVVVATFNRCGLLKDCLASLFAQNYKNFEIIVVDDGSSDETGHLLQTITDARIKIIRHEKNLGLSASRNDGIRAALYDFVAFTDDDCVADQNWLAQIMQAMQAGNVDFAAGQTIWASKGYHGSFPERLVQNPNASWPMGNNLIYSKKVFLTAGLFDPKMDYYSNDDSEMAIRAISFGFKFKQIPEAIIYHQKTFWTTKALLQSARNPAVWVILKKRYPRYYLYFQPPVKAGIIIHLADYLQILTMPIFLPLLLIRFIMEGQTKFGLFFTKWPFYPILRRFYIYREVIRNQTLML